MNQFPQKVRFHILGGTGPDLDLRYRDQYLITYDLYLAGISLRGNSLKNGIDDTFSLRHKLTLTENYGETIYHEFLLLSQSLLAQEHNGRFKYKAHRM